MNKVMLVGNLARDPELTQTTSGISVCRFTLAVQRRFQNADGVREADFLPIVVWRAQGENCHKYLKKGSKAGVVGTIQTRNYDASDGTKRYVTEVIADEVEFLSQRSADESGFIPDADSSSTSTASAKKPRKNVIELEPVQDDDDMPF